jgi:hypothetical protein
MITITNYQGNANLIHKYISSHPNQNGHCEKDKNKTETNVTRVDKGSKEVPKTEGSSIWPM